MPADAQRSALHDLISTAILPPDPAAAAARLEIQTRQIGLVGIDEQGVVP